MTKQTMSEISLHMRRVQLGLDAEGHAVWQSTLEKRSVPAQQTAIIICDMWDNHWSRGAAERVNAMAPPMNEVLVAARKQGVHIIHAPSDTMAFYTDHPSRQHILAVPSSEPPVPLDLPVPPLPIDDSDQGSDTGETETYRAWQRQHPALAIDEKVDVISDKGTEVYSYLCQQNIQQVAIMGVHTNMCVLNRSFAIKQLVKWRVAVALVRDLTDTMYNPAMRPYVSHDEGTQLVIGYIERFWCPSLLSSNLVGV
jgi:nicotinamidase-related amidase